MTDDERRDLTQGERVARVLRRRPRDTQVPPFSVIEARLQRRAPLPLMLSAGVAVILLALVVGSALAERRSTVGAPATPTPPAPPSTVNVVQSPEPTPTLTPTPRPYSPPPAFRPASTATAVPASALVRHTNPVLGYSIGMPPRYRLALSQLDGPNNTGQDFFSPRSEQEDRELCERERGSHVGSPDRVDDLRVSVSRNDAGISPVEFVSTPNRRIVFTSVERVTIDGHEAARVFHQPSGDTAYYVMSANGRLYEFTPFVHSQPETNPKGWLDEIAKSFKVLPLQPSSVISRQSLCGN